MITAKDSKLFLLETSAPKFIALIIILELCEAQIFLKKTTFLNPLILL